MKLAIYIVLFHDFTHLLQNLTQNKKKLFIDTFPTRIYDIYFFIIVRERERKKNLKEKFSSSFQSDLNIN